MGWTAKTAESKKGWTNTAVGTRLCPRLKVIPLRYGVQRTGALENGWAVYITSLEETVPPFTAGEREQCGRKARWCGLLDHVLPGTLSTFDL